MQQNSALASSTMHVAQAAQYLGRFFPFKGAPVDLGALTTVVFTGNPPSPNSTGKQKTYLTAGL